MSGTGIDQLPIVDRIMARLGGFIQGIGKSPPLARRIVERAITDDPAAADHDIEAKARVRMLIALA
ncbi:hypothetical protein [Methylobacterium sp. GC_Met_2]|uniref:hypothetical protein n=1 Tax=Methylobacterium sp. GC_Met_2 TaxID=2937376 RepID=UPI00226B9469|nr:hypothetical protein [Methylobacterium sp. GC_Met_2]